MANAAIKYYSRDDLVGSFSHMTYFAVYWGLGSFFLLHPSDAIPNLLAMSLFMLPPIVSAYHMLMYLSKTLLESQKTKHSIRRLGLLLLALQFVIGVSFISSRYKLGLDAIDGPIYGLYTLYYVVIFSRI